MLLTTCSTDSADNPCSAFTSTILAPFGFQTSSELSPQSAMTGKPSYGGEASESAEGSFEPTERSRVKRLHKRGHYDRETVYEVLDAGLIWVGPPPVRLPNLPTRRWLYQITVDAPLRGKGYGRAMLAATEELVSGEGARELYLNVFRWNSVARALYDSAGYEVVHDSDTETGMRKSLGKEVAR